MIAIFELEVTAIFVNEIIKIRVILLSMVVLIVAHGVVPTYLTSITFVGKVMLANQL